MESKNLGSKKMNDKQNPSEDINTGAIPESYDPTTSKLVTEIETNKDGDQKVVHRARNVDSKATQNNNINSDSPSCSVELFSDKDTQRMIENKDHNSDITAFRYPNSDPDNHEDRGNIKLDQ